MRMEKTADFLCFPRLVLIPQVFLIIKLQLLSESCVFFFWKLPSLGASVMSRNCGFFAKCTFFFIRSHFNSSDVLASDLGFTRIPFGDEEALRAAVALVGPVSVVLDAEHFADYKSGGCFVQILLKKGNFCFRFPLSGVFHDDSCCPAVAEIQCLSHAVLVSCFTGKCGVCNGQIGNCHPRIAVFQLQKFSPSQFPFA